MAENDQIYKNCVKLAADSPGALRGCDVFRVLGWAHQLGELRNVARRLRADRPGLARWIDEATTDIRKDKTP